MKNFVLFFSVMMIIVIFSAKIFSQEKSKDQTTMKRFVVERSFPQGINLPVNEMGCQIILGVVTNNTEDQVTWIHSYVSADKKKTFCIYEAPSPEAIKKAAEKNGLPVDNITQVTILDPYFYN